MPKSSSEIIAEQCAERWRKRVVQQDAEILRLKNRVIELARTCEHLLQRLQEAGVDVDETERRHERQTKMDTAASDEE